LGEALVAGRKRVPSPAAGIRALRIGADDMNWILRTGLRKVKDAALWWRGLELSAGP